MYPEIHKKTHLIEKLANVFIIINSASEVEVKWNTSLSPFRIAREVHEQFFIDKTEFKEHINFHTKNLVNFSVTTTFLQK